MDRECVATLQRRGDVERVTGDENVHQLVAADRVPRRQEQAQAGVLQYDRVAGCVLGNCSKECADLCGHSRTVDAHHTRIGWRVPRRADTGKQNVIQTTDVVTLEESALVVWSGSHEHGLVADKVTR